MSPKYWFFTSSEDSAMPSGQPSVARLVAASHSKLSNHDANMPTSMAKSMLDRVPIR